MIGLSYRKKPAQCGETKPQRNVVSVSILRLGPDANSVHLNKDSIVYRGSGNDSQNLLSSAFLPGVQEEICFYKLVAMLSRFHWNGNRAAFTFVLVRTRINLMFQRFSAFNRDVVRLRETHPLLKIRKRNTPIVCCLATPVSCYEHRITKLLLRFNFQLGNRTNRNSWKCKPKV